jgi:hypothetical protein
VDCTNTTSTATSFPFHEVQYKVTWGDTPTAWSYGAWAGDATYINKNVSYGAVAAHVYETPGTYPIKVTATDASGSTAETTIGTVTASAFANDTTAICVSKTGSFTGCPSNATQTTTSSFTTAMNTAAGKKQIYFEGGQTFTFTSGPATISTAGPGIISSYGTGKATISTTASETSGFQITSNDWRIKNLIFSGANSDQYSNGVKVSGTTNTTVDAVDVSRFHAQIDFEDCCSGGGAVQLVIIDSTVGGLPAQISGSNYGMFGGVTTGQKYLAVMGNSASIGPNNNPNGHLMRLQPTCRWCVISNNSFADNGSGISMTKMDAQGSSEPDQSRFMIYSDNRVIGSTGIYFRAQNTASNECLNNVVFERNWLGGGTGIEVRNSASPATFRNNVFDQRTGTSQGGTALGIGAYGCTAPVDNVWVYNNSLYTNDVSTATWLKFLMLGNEGGGSALGHVTAKNNVLYYPSASSPLFVEDDSTGATLDFQYNTCSNGSGANCRGAVTTNPYTNASAFSPANAKPTASSYAIGAGASIPVWSDFFGAAWSGTRDSGAVHH